MIPNLFRLYLILFGISFLGVLYSFNAKYQANELDKKSPYCINKKMLFEASDTLKVVDFEMPKNELNAFIDKELQKDGDSNAHFYHYFSTNVNFGDFSLKIPFYINQILKYNDELVEIKLYESPIIRLKITREGTFENLEQEYGTKQALNDNQIIKLIKKKFKENPHSYRNLGDFNEYNFLILFEHKLDKNTYQKLINIIIKEYLIDLEENAKKEFRKEICYLEKSELLELKAKYPLKIQLIWEKYTDIRPAPPPPPAFYSKKHKKAQQI
jgi:hypothetical protein